MEGGKGREEGYTGLIDSIVLFFFFFFFFFVFLFLFGYFIHKKKIK